MRSTLVIAAHELRRYFASPLAWICLGCLQVLLALVFWLLLGEFSTLQPPPGEPRPGAAEFIGGGLFGFASFIYLLLIPILSMRSLAEERQQQSLSLYQASPVSNLELVLGKYLGLLGLLGLGWLLLALMPLSLGIGTRLDYGLIAAYLLGLALLQMAFAAVGLFASSLAGSPGVAAIVSFGLLLGLWLLQLLSVQDGWIGVFAAQLSLLGQLEGFRQGLFSSASMAFYLLFSAVFLCLSWLRLNWEQQS